MTKNHLGTEISPYLQQHKDNPVHWYAWGPTALAAAKATNKPILLSIGYAACHWCHVMAHESFEDAATAAVMNEHFINIKVDREERPDIDKIYMNAIHILGEQGGWPLTMFLTPEGDPFWGGTYFPKTPQYGRPGFVQVLQQLHDVYHNQPDNVLANTNTIKNALRAQTEIDDKLQLTPEIADQTAERLLKQIDFEHGGLKGAPKFPQTTILEFLWRTGMKNGKPEYLDAVTISLTNMCQGGIYDHLGGGFSRYSVDAVWLAPHFEKMLYDNALLIDCLTRSYQVTKNPLFRQRVEETIIWLEKEMTTKEGAFCASLDADSEGVEGKFYVWNADDLKRILHEDYTAFAEIYDVTEAGNWEGATILNRLNAQHLEDNTLEELLTKNRRKLLSHRDQRIRPGLDDKILTDWNGLMISALSNASIAFNNDDWLKLAQKAYGYIIDNMIIDGSLHHAARNGEIHHLTTSDGYANLIQAALSLFQATNQTRYLTNAEDLTSTFNQHYWDSDKGGYFFTSDDSEALIVRTKTPMDDATPNANGIMAQNLAKMYLLAGKQEYLTQIDDIFAAFTTDLFQNIFGSASLLNAFHMRTQLLSVVFVPTGDEAQDDPILKAIRTTIPASAALSILSEDFKLDRQHPAHGKTVINDKPTVYICQNNTCSTPLTEEEDIITILSAL